jgi:hypothetical protein
LSNRFQSNGPFNNLMPVGKLRRFDVMLKNEDKEDKVTKAKVDTKVALTASKAA